MHQVLDFCAECGALIPEGTGNLLDPRCLNCDAPVSQRNQRLQGTFSEQDANRLKEINFG